MGVRMVYGQAWMGGGPVATCPSCGAVCAYWDSDDMTDGCLLCNACSCEYCGAPSARHEGETGRACCACVDCSCDVFGDAGV